MAYRSVSRLWRYEPVGRLTQSVGFTACCSVEGRSHEFVDCSYSAITAGNVIRTEPGVLFRVDLGIPACGREDFLDLSAIGEPDSNGSLSV